MLLGAFHQASVLAALGAEVRLEEVLGVVCACNAALMVVILLNRLQIQLADYVWCFALRLRFFAACHELSNCVRWSLNLMRGLWMLLYLCLVHARNDICWRLP